MGSTEQARKRLEVFAAAWRRRRSAHASAGLQLNRERDEAMRDAQAKGLTQTEIAAAFGFSQQQVSNILRSPRS